VAGSQRPAAWPALLAYVAAFVLALASNLALLLGAAAMRAHGPREAILDEA
jgi:hypothetical protein